MSTCSMESEFLVSPSNTNFLPRRGGPKQSSRRIVTEVLTRLVASVGAFDRLFSVVGSGSDDGDGEGEGGGGVSERIPSLSSLAMRGPLGTPS